MHLLDGVCLLCQVAIPRVLPGELSGTTSGQRPQKSAVWTKNAPGMLAIGDGLMQKIQWETSLAIVQILWQKIVEAVKFV
jgi:hypothetical protein